MTKILPFYSAACLALLACLAACEKRTIPKFAPTAVPSPAVAVPPEQQALVPVLAADDCAKFQQSQTFDNWLVTVDDVETSTVNQSIDITFGAGQHIGLEQVIQTTNPLYPAVANLRQGGTARISGRFTHGNGECSYRLTTVGIALGKVG